jgi:hypothetical protein
LPFWQCHRQHPLPYPHTLKRKQVAAFFAALPACLVGMEACGSAHFWGRKLAHVGTIALVLVIAALAAAYSSRAPAVQQPPAAGQVPAAWEGWRGAGGRGVSARMGRICAARVFLATEHG